ncbi:hypothetical protein OO013_08730 [Mangrovivirga sp. M17]|uniref:Uncharacterized protein n=1 Tax=Mangrovivirga halotolerans TaxID=2993936 RepID=A0ABT3RRE2_9BACT|nr:hypothetical protein [Mangrovivirga halotolerans]MCX2743949.1 hypothetical protein [Mangrovivirga halotolerans]
MTDEWHSLNIVHTESLNNSIVTLHKLSQFVSRVGQNYLKPRKDYSHTNLGWDKNSSTLVGRRTEEGVRVTFNLPEFKYKVEARSHHSIVMPEDLTYGELEDLMKHLLIAAGLIGSHYVPSDEYSLPYEIDSDEHIDKPKRKFLSHWADCRSNADLVLHKLAALFAGASEVRIWPHHFDSGLIIPLKVENEKILKSIGAGLAIADHMVNEPYFYLNYFDENKASDFKVNDLEDHNAISKNSNEYTGYLLPLSLVLSNTGSEAQFNYTWSFFEQGIDQIMNAAGINKQIV